jgi:putative DNA methylase
MEENRMSDVRLIERWLPIAALGEESVRERRSMTALPPIYYLHVWWARRPLVASRAAILASILPESSDRAKFMDVLGIHGDPVATRQKIDRAKRTGEDLGANPYGYKRAFQFYPTQRISEIFPEVSSDIRVLDPTAGGGSIPFEARRIGTIAIANDLNPVAAIILKATIDWPFRFGPWLLQDFIEVRDEFLKRANQTLVGVYPTPESERVDGYLWARSITCPYCAGLIPLSPNWRLAPGGAGIRLRPKCGGGVGSIGRVCEFEITEDEAEQSSGTISGGDATCPFPDCGRVVGGDEIKRQAHAGQMGQQLFALAIKRLVRSGSKSGAVGKQKWERGFRAATHLDDNAAVVAERLAEKLPEWEALDVVPSEEFPADTNDDRPRQYGMPLWRDMFSPRQLLGHGLVSEVFHEMVGEDSAAGRLSERRRAAYVYLSFSLDKLRDYNSRMSVWHSARGVITNTFSQHDFSFKWSHAEMALAHSGGGLDWVTEQTGKCIKELVDLSNRGGSGDGSLFSQHANKFVSEVVLSSKPGDSLDHLADGSVDAVVMDPPYGANVMYAELSDFFYVWLKRTAGLVVPEFFTRRLTDKQSEAVANKARFKGQKGADALAHRDYQEKMSAIFAECRRVLKPTGIMTVMFTHKDASAWDALTKGLIEAGFVITASWPVNTEAEGSLHIKDKAAANSTIFLVCRPRVAELAGETTYWEDVEPLVAKAVRTRVEEFQKAGIVGVDLYLASFGPALEEFSRH